MFVNFHYIGINNKFLNLSQVVLIEDLSDDNGSKALITTAEGQDIEFVGEDAELLIERVETLLDMTDDFFNKVQQPETVH